MKNSNKNFAKTTCDFAKTTCDLSIFPRTYTMTETKNASI